MITPAERIVLKPNETLKASTLTAKGYNAIELNGILSGNNSTQVGINGTGNMTWRLSDKLIKITGTETITASEQIVIIAGYDPSALVGFTSGTAHGVIKKDTDILTSNIDTTKYNISSFEYYILGSRYVSIEQLGVSANFTTGESFKIIMVGTAGIYLLPANTFPTPDDLVTDLEIGVIRTTDGVNIDIIRNSAFFINEVFRNLYIWSKFVKRTNYLSNAGLITENATPNRLDIQSGKTIDSNLSLAMVDAVSQISVSEVYHVAGTYTIASEISAYSVNTSQIDNGTDLVSITPSKFTTHTLLRGATSKRLYLVFGVNEYGTAELALAEPVNRGIFQEGSDIDPIAQIVVDRQAGTIDRIIDIRNT